tara:strand:- start:5440 stop:6264 length:825 start_codon:yes stop_codon:yes gene_type:complete
MKNVVIHPALDTLSLYSGIGGLELGLAQALRINVRAYIEREFSCVRILAQRSEENRLDKGLIYSDVESFPVERYRDKISVIIGGFPCQPWSQANHTKNKGETDSRNGWPQVIRFIRTIRPDLVFLENVPNILNHEYFGTILGDLSQAGFNAEWGCFQGLDVGIPQHRERLFILGYANDKRLEGWGKFRFGSGERSTGQTSPELGDQKSVPPTRDNIEGWTQVWTEMPDLKPAICKLATGVPDRMGQLQMFGNAVIPAVATFAFNQLADRIMDKK